MPRYKVFAAIDLGSTEITMKIAEVSKKNGISVLDTVKYDLSIGKESYAVGKISYNLVDKICNCFEEYLRIMKSYGVDEYVCYATTAVREASNSEYIIDQINIRTGIKVTIISNEEERFLHNKAFALNNSYFDDIIEAGAVLVDVASGSVQVSHYEQSKLQFSQNLPMGSLRVLENLSTVKNSTTSFSSVLEDFIKAGINNYKNVFYKNPNYKYFVIMGNQVRYIKKICGISSDSITEENIDDVIKSLKEFSKQTGAVIIVTGEIDIVTNDKDAYIIKNGHAVMSSITGTGCMLSAMTCAYICANTDNMLKACLASVCLMGYAGEKAYEKMVETKAGNSSFRNYLIDAIYNMSGEELDKGAKYEHR